MTTGKTLRRSTLGALIAAACATPAAAQSPMGLMDAYRQALESDPQLAAARAARDGGEERITQGRGQLMPSVNLNASYKQRGQETVSTQQIGGQTTSFGSDGDYRETQYQVNLQQPLFSLTAIGAFQAGKAEAARVSEAYSQAEQEAILRVAERYFGVLAARESLEAARAEMDAMERRLAAARQGQAVGISARTEVDEALARRDQARATLIRAENELEVSRQELAILLGEMPEGLAGLDGIPPARDLAPAEPGAWEQRALERSPAVAQAREAVELQQANVLSKQGERWPTVNFVASYTDTEGGIYDSSDYTEDTSYGVEFRMPIFSGGTLKAQEDEARAAVREAEENLEQARRSASLEARRGYLNARSARSSLEAVAQAVESAGTARDATRQGYRNGLNSQVELLDAEQRYYASQRDLADAKYGYLESLLALQAAVGDLDEGDVRAMDALFGSDDPTWGDAGR
ncbi:MAG: TolC family outer membrane protein [Pseudomonadota bacterium]